MKGQKRRYGKQRKPWRRCEDRRLKKSNQDKMVLGVMK